MTAPGKRGLQARAEEWKELSELRPGDFIEIGSVVMRVLESERDSVVRCVRDRDGRVQEVRRFGDAYHTPDRRAMVRVCPDFKPRDASATETSKAAEDASTWIQHEAGWYTLRGVGGVCREADGWAWWPVDGSEPRRGFKTLKEAQRAAIIGGIPFVAGQAAPAKGDGDG